mgnify:CR=1 FL=1
MIAAAAFAGITALLALVVVARIMLAASPQASAESALSPGLDQANTLLLEQATADLALNAYVELERANSLDAYRQAIGRATTVLDELEKTVQGHSDLVDLVAGARTAQRTWVKTDAEPVVTLMEAGKRPRAMRETNSTEARAAFDAMTASARTLHDSVNAAREQAAASVAGVTRLLLILTVLAVLVVAGAITALFIALRTWVLEPLEAVGASVRRAADSPDHASPIVPSGPPEIRAVALDAELLRRDLVKEIDEAEQAREGLVQDAPLVAAMRAELLGAPALPDSDLAIAGWNQSAEGVVSGDWWDSILLPNGSFAAVVADVSGHGAEASVVALRVRAVLRAALLSGQEPHEAMSMAASACGQDVRVITAVIVVADPVAGTIRWCNAGHHPAIIVTRDKESALCEPTGPLMSSLGGEWTTRERPFGPGDVVVAFTDGLVEARNADGDELESSAVAQFIRGMDAPVRENPGELIERLLAQVRHRAADWRHDDVTIVAISRRT